MTVADTLVTETREMNFVLLEHLNTVWSVVQHVYECLRVNLSQLSRNALQRPAAFYNSQPSNSNLATGKNINVVHFQAN